MTDFFTNEIFAPEDDNDAALEDVQTAMAGALFEKLAEEAGVDPDSLTSQERAAYINQLRGKEAPGASKEASTTMTMTPEEQQQVEWDAFVTQEAIKTAAAHDVDALEMEPADFAQLKANVEEVIAADVEGYMQKLSAAYQEENAVLLADEEFERKMEESKLAGQQMAITFADMLGLEIPAEKIAGVGGKLKGFLARAGERAQGASETIGRGVEKHTGIGRGGAKKILDAASEIPKGRSGGQGIVDHANAEARSALKKHYGNVGKAAVGTGAALGIAGGAAAASGRSKKSAEEVQAEGLAVARAFMIAQGIDPDSGSKLASLDNLDPEVEAAAAALLERAGVNLG